MKFKWKQLQEQESMQCDDMNNMRGEHSIKTCLFCTYMKFYFVCKLFFFPVFHFVGSVESEISGY